MTGAKQITPEPGLPPDYLEWIKKSTTWLEQLGDKFTTVDQRVDYVVKHLAKANAVIGDINAGIKDLLLKEEEKAKRAPPLFPGLPKYNILSFKLDKARSGERVDMPGDTITAFTDGTLVGVYVRLDSPTADAIPLNEFNPYRLSSAFTEFYLDTTAQPGKYLILHIGREGSAEASLGLMPVSLDIANLTGNIPISLDIGNLVGNIPIDIKAQAVGNIKIDIAAQAVGNLNVNIAASSATINVSGSVTISSGTVSITGTPTVAISQTGANNTVQITGTPTVSISGTPSVTISGTPAVTITSGSVTATVTGSVSITGTPAVTISGTPAVTITSGSVTATVSGSVSITGTPSVTITSGSVTATISGTVNMNITAADIMMPVDIQAQYITLDINIKSQTANVNVDLAAQTIGNIGIDIKAQTVGNLAVNIAASSATITVTGSVTISSGTVSISGTPTVAISQTGANNTVQITGTPTVSISGTPSVTITGTPAVTITSGAVTATVSGSVSITGTPAVTITSGSISVTTGSITILDPADVWGNTHSLGLAELAARLGSPDTFDRRGNVLWMDDFENGIEAWSPQHSGADYFSWIPTYHRTGGFCVKMSTPATTNASNYMVVYLPYPVLSKMGFEFNFWRVANLKTIILDIWFLTGADLFEAEIRWTVATNTWAYYGTDDTYHDLSPTINLYEALLFNTVKLVADFVNSKYVRLIANNTTYDMSNLGLYTAESLVGPYVQITIRIDTNANAVATAYVDDVIITQNEP